jgi:PPOX class probable F420-dependent enzyme
VTRRLDPGSRAFLERPLFGKLATLMRDGSPQVTPVWYMLERGKLIVNTARGRVKYWNMKRDPRVCLLVDDGYSYVSVFGAARLATERDAMKDIETLAVRYRGEKRGRADARNRYWKMKRVSFEVIPTRLVIGP